MSVRQPVCPRTTSALPLVGFSCNLILRTRKSAGKLQILLKQEINVGLYKDRSVFLSDTCSATVHRRQCCEYYIVDSDGCTSAIQSKRTVTFPRQQCVMQTRYNCYVAHNIAYLVSESMQEVYKMFLLPIHFFVH